jgi:opacity protein-like surface antigen
MLTRLMIAPLCCFAWGAHADETIAPNLPTLALNPQAVNGRAADGVASPWSGFYFGSEITAFSHKGAKGLVGGSALAGYNHEFGNRMVLGIETSVGFAPNIFTRGAASGYDFAATKFKLGYDMGRLMPFVTGSVVLAKPTIDTGIGFVGVSDTVNNLFNDSSHVKTFGSIGAGFDYALTNNLSLGITVSANKGAGFPTWP